MGNGTPDEERTPVDVSSMASGVTAVTAGESHTCAIQNGRLYCWGENSAGQLGTESTTESLIPVLVHGLDNTITSVSAGDFHTCATTGGDIYCWGHGAQGQLGNGDTNRATKPSYVVLLTSSSAYPLLLWSYVERWIRRLF